MSRRNFDIFTDAVNADINLIVINKLWLFLRGTKYIEIVLVRTRINALARAIACINIYYTSLTRLQCMRAILQELVSLVLFLSLTNALSFNRRHGARSWHTHFGLDDLNFWQEQEASPRYRVCLNHLQDTAHITLHPGFHPLTIREFLSFSTIYIASSTSNYSSFTIPHKLTLTTYN